MAYRADGDLVGIDACLPLDLAGDMLFAASAQPGPVRPWSPRPFDPAAEVISKNGHLVQVTPGQRVSLEIEVPHDSIEKVLAPARAAGFDVRDDEGMLTSRRATL
jgi:hypothetical protein